MKYSADGPIASEGGGLFEPASWLIKIDFINQFILNNNALISLLGEDGCGKTTFAQLLQDKLDPSVVSVLLTAPDLFDESQLVTSFCTALDLPKMDSLSEIVALINQKKTRTLLMIDDAENLPEAFIVALLDILKGQGTEGYFHVCLLSDFFLVKLTSRLAKDAYKNMIHSIELQPLDESETKAYVRARMNLILDKKTELSIKKLKQFYEMTQGSILAINENMLDFFAKKPSWIFQWKENHIIPGAALVFIFFAVCMVFLLRSPFGEKQPYNVIEAKKEMELTQVELPLTSYLPNYSFEAVYQPIEVVSLQKADLLVKNEMIEESGEDPIDESLVVMDKVVPTPKAIAPRVKKKVIEPKTVKHQLAAQVKAKVPPKQKLVYRRGYTIQLFAGREKTKVNSLLRQYPASVGMRIRQFEIHGVTWYVLTKGEYADKRAAKMALASLPSHLVQLKPWIRSTANLKETG